MAEIIVRYAHFAAILGLTATLIAEYILLAPQISNATLQKLVRLDSLYGLSALVVLIAGLLLWFWTGKPADFYSYNAIFLAKVVLFIAIGLLSVYPTVFFLRQRKNPDSTITIPGSIIKVVKLEIMMLFLMPLLAVLMARGYGAF